MLNYADAVRLHCALFLLFELVLSFIPGYPVFYLFDVVQNHVGDVAQWYFLLLFPALLALPSFFMIGPHSLHGLLMVSSQIRLVGLSDHFAVLEEQLILLFHVVAEAR